MTKKSKKQGKKIENDNNNNNKVSGSKRVRFSEEEFEFDHEESLERVKRRRGGVKLEGYESDETDISEDKEEEEDMFAGGDGTDKTSKLTKKSEEEAYNVVENKKNLRYLDSEEIVGQDFTSKDTYDEESGEPLI